ncbi:MAG: GNAT family N-acetyltransferase [Rubrivivax sp.]|nr:GNAT family N-acetyltransferase [Rubrivivax sp.]
MNTNPDAVRIEPITLAHAAAFHACLDAVARERRFLGQTQAPPPDKVLAFVRENVDSDAVQFVAMDGTQLVGWADVFGHWADALAHCGSLGMGLLPAWRGHGIGQRLLQACIDKAWQKGFTRIELQTRVDNGAAIRLYQRLGFRDEGLCREAMRLDGVLHDTRRMALLRCDAPAPAGAGPTEA